MDTGQETIWRTLKTSVDSWLPDRTQMIYFLAESAVLAYFLDIL
jgi:hypothetical protein